MYLWRNKIRSPYSLSIKTPTSTKHSLCPQSHKKFKLSIRSFADFIFAFLWLSTFWDFRDVIYFKFVYFIILIKHRQSPIFFIWCIMECYATHLSLWRAAVLDLGSTKSLLPNTSNLVIFVVFRHHVTILIKAFTTPNNLTCVPFPNFDTIASFLLSQLIFMSKASNTSLG